MRKVGARGARGRRRTYRLLSVIANCIASFSSSSLNGGRCSSTSHAALSRAVRRGGCSYTSWLISRAPNNAGTLDVLPMKMPVGSPFSSRTIWPPSGSSSGSGGTASTLTSIESMGQLAHHRDNGSQRSCSRPARRVAELAHSAWPSMRLSHTGVVGKAPSKSSLVGHTGGSHSV